MEQDQTARILRSFGKIDSETQERIYKIRDSVEKLPEVPVYKEKLGGLKEGDIFEGSGINGSIFKACMIVIGEGEGRNKALRLDLYGDVKGRTKIAVDFMIALESLPDVRSGAHDDLDCDERLYWKMSQ